MIDLKLNPCGCKALPQYVNNGNFAKFQCETCAAFGRVVRPYTVIDGVEHALPEEDVKAKAAEHWNNGNVRFETDDLLWRVGAPWGDALDGRLVLLISSETIIPARFDDSDDFWRDSGNDPLCMPDLKITHWTTINLPGEDEE